MAEKDIVVQFFMKRCPYCIEFSPSWNEIVREVSEAKGTAFLMVDGPEQHELRRKYRVSGFPDFVFIRAGSKGQKSSKFDDRLERTKQTMLEWIYDQVEISQSLRVASHHSSTVQNENLISEEDLAKKIVI